MADKESKELAFFNAFGAGALTPEQSAEVEAFAKQGMKEEAYGLPLTYPVLKLVHQGNASIAFPEESGLPPVREMSGVIVHIETGRVYWKKSFQETGGGAMPDCFSRDLMKPDPASGVPQSDTCASCPNNQWGSHIDQSGKPGKGKACREMRRLFVIPEGHVVPYILVLSPANLRSLSKYLTSLGDAKIQRPQMVVTKFKTANVPNASGIKYTELSFEMAGRLNPAAVLQVMEFKRQIEGVIGSAAPVTSDEVA